MPICLAFGLGISPPFFPLSFFPFPLSSPAAVRKYELLHQNLPFLSYRIQRLKSFVVANTSGCVYVSVCSASSALITARNGTKQPMLTLFYFYDNSLSATAERGVVGLVPRSGRGLFAKVAQRFQP